jgi:membrane-associated HD superfamily phosphohydrolase
MDLDAGVNIENTAPLAIGQVPAKKGKKRHHTPETCQNCGATLLGEYCHACGQYGHVHRSVLHVIEEAFHGITHFDSRTWRSLPMLAFRPGTLTRNYVMGQRTRYVPPFAMFLFSIFAMFLAFAFSGGPNFVSDETGSQAASVQTVRAQVAQNESDLRDAQAEVTSAEKELTDLRVKTDTKPGDIGAATGQLAATRAALANAQRDLETSKVALNTAIAQKEAKAKAGASGSIVKIDINGSSGDAAERAAGLAEIAKDREKAKAEGNVVEANVLGAVDAVVKASPPSSPPSSQADTKVDGNETVLEMLKQSMRDGTFIVTPWPEINAKIAKKTQNPELFLYKLQNTAYKFSFLFIPLSLPFIWLMLFWKRNVTLYDHAVFTLYSLSFVSFLFLFISLAAHWMDVGGLATAAMCILPVHIFFQFKGAYALKWFSALWRTILFCTVFSWVIIMVFLLSILALGALG